jgi:dynein heavy chain
MKECTNDMEEDTVFVDFLEESQGKPVYNEVHYKDREMLKQFCEDKLKDYNEKSKSS